MIMTKETHPKLFARLREMRLLHDEIVEEYERVTRKVYRSHRGVAPRPGLRQSRRDFVRRRFHLEWNLRRHWK